MTENPTTTTIQLVKTDHWESGPLGDDAYKEYTLVIDGVDFPEAVVRCAWSKRVDGVGKFHYEGTHPALDRPVYDVLKPRSAKATAARLVRAMRRADLLEIK